MELGAEVGAGQGMGFRGEVEGNLGEKTGHRLCHCVCVSTTTINLYTYFSKLCIKASFSKTLPTCTAQCCPPDPLSPSDPSHLQSHGSSEISWGAAPSAAWWHQGQNCCCCGAAGEAIPQRQRRWSRRSSAESSAGVSWGAYQPETNESPHSTEKEKKGS